MAREGGPPRESISHVWGRSTAPGYGTTTTQKGLFAPHDVKVIGDYTGLTPLY
jgi:hypothetical protein